LAITPASGRYGDRPNRGVSRAKIGRWTSKVGIKRTPHRCFKNFNGPWAHAGNMKGYHRAPREKNRFITPIPPGISSCLGSQGQPLKGFWGGGWYTPYPAHTGRSEASETCGGSISTSAACLYGLGPFGGGADHPNHAHYGQYSTIMAYGIPGYQTG
jgi:hypothetical protein